MILIHTEIIITIHYLKFKIYLSNLILLCVLTASELHILIHYGQLKGKIQIFMFFVFITVISTQKHLEVTRVLFIHTFI